MSLVWECRGEASSHPTLSRDCCLKWPTFRTCLSFTGSRCAARQPICVTVVLAWSMYDGKIERLQTWDPPGYHPLWLSKVAREMSPCQIVFEQLYGHHDGQQFLIGRAVTALGVTQGHWGVGYYFFLATRPPSSCSCSRTAPIPTSLASVLRTKWPSRVG